MDVGIFTLFILISVSRGKWTHIKSRNQEEKINNGIIVSIKCNANMSKSIFTAICIYCLYKGVHINLWFIWPLEIKKKVLVHWVLCGAKHNRRNLNTDHAVDTCRNFNQNVQWLCLIVYKLIFFWLKWYCCINIKYIYIVEKYEIYLYSEACFSFSFYSLHK